MLRAYLQTVKQKSVLSQVEAISALKGKIGSEWEAEKGGLTWTFKFETYEHANNFLVRYNSYCEKVNSAPQWSNVYNRVSVTLKCDKIGEITTKEVSIAKYLNMVADVSHRMQELRDRDLYHHEEVFLPMDHARNNPSLKTMIEAHEYPRLWLE